jgi:hypothetical protein
MYTIKQSTAETVPFYVHDGNGDPVLSLTNGSFTKTISKNGAAFGAMTVTITEMEKGWYSIPLSTAHSNTLGILSITFTNAGAKQVNLQWRVEVNLVDTVSARIPAALVSGLMSSDITALATSTAAAGNLRESALQIIQGLAEGTPTVTDIQTDLAETQDDIYIGRIVMFTDGPAKHEVTEITDYTGSTGTLIVVALANAPAVSDPFIIV